MKKEQKRYVERNDLKGANHLEISVYYTKGGANIFSGGTTPRGYYLCVRPVTMSNGMISFNIFAGRRKLLLKTERYSAKQFDLALNMSKDCEDELVAAVIAKNAA
jgi:hypothetical protein